MTSTDTGTVGTLFHRWTALWSGDYNVATGIVVEAWSVTGDRRFGS